MVTFANTIFILCTLAMKLIQGAFVIRAQELDAQSAGG